MSWGDVLGKRKVQGAAAGGGKGGGGVVVLRERGVGLRKNGRGRAGAVAGEG